MFLFLLILISEYKPFFVIYFYSKISVFEDRKYIDMGLRDLFRKYRKRHDNTHHLKNNDTDESRVNHPQPHPSQPQQQQQRNDKFGLYATYDSEPT